MEQPLLEIKDIELGYSSEKVVLSFPELKIPRGKMVFLLGPSGVGKSTLLEFLGLMTDSCLNRPKGIYQLNEGSTSIDLAGIWNREDDEISQIRQDHFSFVFQSTNLMPNFTIGENMCFNLLVNGHSMAEAKETVLGLMDDLDLPRNLFDKRVTEASGGQKQRIAFVRAFGTSFSVLFGDEPTGNLDEKNAIRLFERLKAKITELNKTAVIVSHDLNLAKRFADLTIQMVPGTDGNPSTIEVS